MIDERDIAGLAGSAVRDPDGDKIGTVGQVYVDPKTGRPNWTTVKTGLFGTSESFVPLDGADVVDGDLRVRYAKDVVKDAPRIDGEAEVTQDQQEHLYSYYRRADSDAAGGPAARDDDPGHHGSDSRSFDDDHDRDGDGGRDLADDDRDRADDAGESRGIRLRKHVVTEYQTVTIPVEREEIVVEGDADPDSGEGARDRG